MQFPVFQEVMADAPGKLDVDAWGYSGGPYISVPLPDCAAPILLGDGDAVQFKTGGAPMSNTTVNLP